jgi:hypothetical protein
MVSTGPERDKETVTRARLAAGFLVLAVFTGGGCRPDPSTPRGTAERFLDAHYVAIDLREAIAFTSGIAKQKVEQEIALVSGVEIDENTRKPVVHYKLLEERPDGEHSVNFLYRGSIAVDGADGFERRWMVTVRREDAGWRVTNYQEFDG